MNGTTLSNIHVNPSKGGSFSLTAQISAVLPSDKGVWTVTATYAVNTAEAKFTVR